MKTPFETATHHQQMAIREIVEDDADVIIMLLCEGFPKRNIKHWRHAFQQMCNRPIVNGYPKFGYVLMVGGKPGGLLLMLTALIDGVPQSNLSSWYVREKYRKYAIFMFQRAISRKGGQYLNLSPSPVALPIATAFGFTPYTKGSLLVHPAALFVGSQAQARLIRTEETSMLSDMLQRNVAYGCKPLFVSDAMGYFPALYQVEKIKKISAARFVHGDPHRLLSAAPAILRLLFWQGLPLLLIDAPPLLTPPASWSMLLPNRGRRYYKGTNKPEVGNLLETELAVFGA